MSGASVTEKHTEPDAKHEEPSEITVKPGSSVILNELMASNTRTIADPQGEFDDWIELYNSGSEPVELTGMYLSDSTKTLNKWQFPEGAVLQPGEYLVVWADEDKKAEEGYHLNFKLSAAGKICFWLIATEPPYSIRSHSKLKQPILPSDDSPKDRRPGNPLRQRQVLRTTKESSP